MPAFSPEPTSGEAPSTVGVILAIDYGRKRLGLALSDEQGITSRPFATWSRINRRRDVARLRELVRQQAVRRIVVGLPVHLDGSASEMSTEAKAFAVRIQKALGISVELMDERLSSWAAKQTLYANRSRRHRASLQGTSTKRVPLDDLAAAVILRDYLNRGLNQGKTTSVMPD